jgi:hypothetical protein
MATLHARSQAGKEFAAAFLETRRFSAYVGGTTEANKWVDSWRRWLGARCHYFAVDQQCQTNQLSTNVPQVGGHHV